MTSNSNGSPLGKGLLQRNLWYALSVGLVESVSPPPASVRKSNVGSNPPMSRTSRTIGREGGRRHEHSVDRRLQWARGSRLSPSWLSGWEMTAVMSRASRGGIIVTCCLPSLAARAGTPARGATVPGTSWRRVGATLARRRKRDPARLLGGDPKAADRDTPP
jgi:hypothetical protein